MRRALRILLKTLAGAALLWCGLWFAGKLVIENRIAAEAAALADRGITLRHASQEISGFPFGYTAVWTGLEFRDPASGTGTVLPRLATRYEVTAPTRLDLDLPETFEITLPVSPELPPMRFEVEATGLSLTAEGLPGEAQVLRLRADSLFVVHAAEGQPFNAAVELTDVDARITRPAAGAAGESRLVAQLGALDLLATLVQPDAPALTIDLKGQKIVLTGTTRLPEPSALAALLWSGEPVPGGAALTVQAAEAATSLTGTLPEGQARISAAAGLAVMALRIGEEGLALDGQGDRVDAELMRTDGTTVTGGELAAGTLQAQFHGPATPAAGMSPLTLRLAALQVAPDARLWSVLDPKETLARAPGEVVVEIEGTGQLLHPLLAPLAPGVPRIQVARLEIGRAEIDGLGARAEAEGAIAAETPGAVPTGDVLLRTRGAFPLLERLVQIGMVPRPTAQWLALWMNFALKPGEDPRELVSELTITGDGLLVNGRPFGAQKAPPPVTADP